MPTETGPALALHNVTNRPTSSGSRVTYLVLSYTAPRMRACSGTLSITVALSIVEPKGYWQRCIWRAASWLLPDNFYCLVIPIPRSSEVFRLAWPTRQTLGELKEVRSATLACGKMRRKWLVCGLPLHLRHSANTSTTNYSTGTDHGDRRRI
jgi:hypothetical protein